MKIKRYNYFFEAKEEESNSRFEDITEALTEYIEKTIESSDKSKIKSHVKNYMRNPDEYAIEGLINDSDIYEFYLKYRNDIDELLSDVKFYDQTPSELNSFSLYDFVIKGTKRAIEEVLSKI